MINPFGFVLSVSLYKIAEKYKNVPVLKYFPPMLISGVLIIIILSVFHIDFEKYNESASWLTFLLMPATISLGYPLYKNIEILSKNKRVIYPMFFAAALCAVVATYIVGKFCHADMNVLISMLPKSVTAPIAVEISKTSGGVPEFTVCTVVLTGVFGALTGHKILKFLKVKNDIAIGLAMGAASHVIGTAKCLEQGREKQVVMSTLALVTVGIITAVIIPVLLYLLHV